ncbi:hypothetical protein COK75_21805 [Bacillus thuringiensis]|nr:hypothetical protein COK75_21805 [Bacillus thuringiensis]
MLELLAFLFILVSFLTIVSQVVKKENFGIINKNIKFSDNYFSMHRKGVVIYNFDNCIKILIL